MDYPWIKLGGKGKKSLASLERRQVKTEEEQRKDKKKGKKDDKKEQKVIYVSSEAYEELGRQLKQDTHYTLYEIASKLGIPLGMARRAVRQLESEGRLVQVSKSGNSRLFLVRQ